jgi:hypothetical protein
VPCDSYCSVSTIIRSIQFAPYVLLASSHVSSTVSLQDMPFQETQDDHPTKHNEYTKTNIRRGMNTYLRIRSTMFSVHCYFQAGSYLISEHLQV